MFNLALRSMLKFASPGLGLASLLMLTACAPSGRDYPAARLSGHVRVAGEPIAEGRVHFMPSTTTPGVPITAEIVGGEYVAENVPLGNNIVTFSAVKETGKTIQETGRDPYPEFVSIIPAKYSQGIPLNVTGDSDAQDFDLSADAL